MQYHVENIRNIKQSIGVGPIETQEQWNQVVDIMIVLQRKRNWDTGTWYARFVTGGYISFNYLGCKDLGFGDGRKSNSLYDITISYETFMEHNTKKIYRIKTLEELRATDNTSWNEARYGTSLFGGASFVDSMTRYCGTEISEEQYNILKSFPTDCIALDGFDDWNFSFWMVKEEIVPIKLENMKKVVAYKLKKEYPGRKIGEIARYRAEVCDSHFLWEDGKQIPTEFQPDQVPEWFEAVYEEKKEFIDIQIGTPLKTIRIYPNGDYRVEDEVANICQMEDLIKLERLFSRQRILANTALPFEYKLERIWVGCDRGTSIGLEDIEKIINAYKEEYES